MPIISFVVLDRTDPSEHHSFYDEQELRKWLLSKLESIFEYSPFIQYGTNLYMENDVCRHTPSEIMEVYDQFPDICFVLRETNTETLIKMVDEIIFYKKSMVYLDLSDLYRFKINKS